MFVCLWHSISTENLEKFTLKTEMNTLSEVVWDFLPSAALIHNGLATYPTTRRTDFTEIRRWDFNWVHRIQIFSHINSQQSIASTAP
jgi:hypothetical protein